MDYVRRLDGLRGIAVLMVLLQHFPAIHGLDVYNRLLSLFKKLGLGYVGVELFFILSGYLITRLLVIAFQQRQQKILTNFYIKRAFRILPVFFLTIGVCFFLLPEFDYKYIAGFLANYYFAFNTDPHPLRHFWSLAVEEQFYLIWPLIVLMAVSYRFRIEKVLMVLMIIAIAVVLYRDVWVATDLSRDLIHRSVETRMIALCVGSYFAVCGLPTKSLQFLFVLMAATVILVMGLQLLSQTGLWPYMKSTKTFGFLIVSSSIFLMAANSESRLVWFFELRPLVAIGVISYGLYVYHLPLFYYLGYSHMQMRGNQASLGVAVMLLSCTFLIAIISWFCMEKPLRSIRKRFLLPSDPKNPVVSLR
jgi:peptidoglycan/LPS O-acetylase OafA/YrhL